MVWNRQAKKGTLVTKTDRYKAAVGTGLSRSGQIIDVGSDPEGVLNAYLTDKLTTPGLFNFGELYNVSFNSSFIDNATFESTNMSTWFRDAGSTTNAFIDDNPYDPIGGDTDTGTSVLLSAGQKTFFASILDSSDDTFTFEGTNSSSGVSLMDESNGFIRGTNAAIGDGFKFEVTNITAGGGHGNAIDNSIDNIAKGGMLSHTTNTQPYSYIHLPITVKVGVNYVVGFDYISSSSDSGVLSLGLSASTAFAADNGMNHRILITERKWFDYGLYQTTPFIVQPVGSGTATAYLVIYLFSRSHNAKAVIDNLYINEVTSTAT